MKRKMTVLSIGAVFLVCASALFAEDRLVPGVYPTIQAGIDAAVPGDAVVIAAGTYTGAGNRDLDFGGSAITVRSADPNNPDVVAATIIDCQGSGRGFHFQNGETSSSVVAGLTITNGYAVLGGGVYCYGSSPTIEKCTFSSNTASVGGGGVAIESCSPMVVNCVFSGNIGGWYGGGINNYDSSTTVKGCIFSGNGSSAGGGMVNFESSATTINCTFSGNYADQGGGIYNYDSSSSSVSNCILWGDTAPDEPEIYGDCSVSYSDVQGGYPGEGNIDADPCFVDAAGGDYHLLEGSSCIDAGDPAYSPVPGETDIDGETRVMGIRVDMGADEFTAAAIPAIEITPTEFEFSADEGGPNPASQILSIRNDGLGTLNWEITEDCGWLSAEPNSGSSTGESDDATLSVDVAGLTPGSYYCELMVSDPCALNSPQTVDVNLTVIGPVIELSAAVFEFVAGVGGPNPADKQLGIRNSGGGRLNWEISEDCGWLSVEPNSGSSTGEVNQVTLSVDVSGLTASNYYCEVMVSDPNAENNPQVVDVSLVVQKPIIELSATEFWFHAEANGPNPEPQLLTIRNSGAGTLNWEIAEDCEWLSAEPNSDSSTGEVDDVNVSVNIAGLAPGQQSCELVVLDPNAENSPQAVAVTLMVYHPPDPDWLVVPSEYPTIQAAIDAAVDGNTVVIVPGTYTGPGNRNLDFGGKAITVRSMYPEDPCVVAGTVIDCENSGRAFYFHSGEKADSVLSGLSITNGSAEDGGGIKCINNSSPTINHCTVSQCSAYGPGWHGGGIYSHSSSPTISNCKILNNSSSGMGAGIECVDGSLQINESTIAGNHAGTYGGGIHSQSCELTIERCLITGNSCTYDGGGLRCGSYSSPVVITTVVASQFVGNQSGDSGGALQSRYS